MGLRLLPIEASNDPRAAPHMCLEERDENAMYRHYLQTIQLLIARGFIVRDLGQWPTELIDDLNMIAATEINRERVSFDHAIGKVDDSTPDVASDDLIELLLNIFFQIDDLKEFASRHLTPQSLNALSRNANRAISLDPSQRALSKKTLFVAWSLDRISKQGASRICKTISDRHNKDCWTIQKQRPLRRWPHIREYRNTQIRIMTAEPVRTLKAHPGLRRLKHPGTTAVLIGPNRTPIYAMYSPISILRILTRFDWQMMQGCQRKTCCKQEPRPMCGTAC